MSFKIKLFSKKPKEKQFEIESPDKNIKCRVRLRDGRVYYEVKKNEDLLIRESRLGFKLHGEDDLGQNLALVRTQKKSENKVWSPIVGEEKQIHNQYNETVFYLTEITEKQRLFSVRFRVFNDGVAFRYEIPPQPSFQRIIVVDELTEFNLDLNGQAWRIPAYQATKYELNYEKWPVYELRDAVHTPLTVETNSNKYLSIHEAALYNYGSMTLKLNADRRLQADITPLSDGNKAYLDLPFDSPWRVIMIADSAIELTVNRMILNLNTPPKEDFSWVKPLKFLGIWWAMYVGEWTWAEGKKHGASTEHVKQYLDWCVKLGVSGLLIEGWNNGWSGEWSMNGKFTDYLHPVADFNMEEVSEKARECNLDLIAQHETVGQIDNYERQLESAFSYLVSNGIHYVKTGYTGSKMLIAGKQEFHHSQAGVLHYQKTVELASRYQIMLNIHEPIKGTGIERTYPNILTREGAKGQEYEGGKIRLNHATILPFTRMLCGAFDYTPGIFDLRNPAKRVYTTLARQLAYYVVFYSGMQMLADRPEIYEKQPVIFEFLQKVPVSWQTTIPLLGKIGEYYAVARRDSLSPDWYVAGVTNEESRRMNLNMEFLEEGVKYTAYIYRDGAASDYRENPLEIEVERKIVERGDFLDIWLAAGGGFAVRLVKGY